MGLLVGFSLGFVIVGVTCFWLWLWVCGVLGDISSEGLYLLFLFLLFGFAVVVLSLSDFVSSSGFVFGYWWFMRLFELDPYVLWGLGAGCLFVCGGLLVRLGELFVF